MNTIPFLFKKFIYTKNSPFSLQKKSSTWHFLLVLPSSSMTTDTTTTTTSTTDTTYILVQFFQKKPNIKNQITKYFQKIYPININNIWYSEIISKPKLNQKSKSFIIFSKHAIKKYNINKKINQSFFQSMKLIVWMNECVTQHTSMYILLSSYSRCCHEKVNKWSTSSLSSVSTWSTSTFSTCSPLTSKGSPKPQQWHR